MDFTPSTIIVVCVYLILLMFLNKLTNFNNNMTKLIKRTSIIITDLLYFRPKSLTHKYMIQGRLTKKFSQPSDVNAINNISIPCTAMHWKDVNIQQQSHS